MNLLYAIFRWDDAYVLGIYTHMDWALDDVAHVIIRNCVQPPRASSALR
jgi:hypothetical protein